MQLTSFTDFGLRALMYLAVLPEGEMASIARVTAVYGVSRNHMVKVINQLSHQGLVAAVRGKNGGIKLGRPANQIVIGEVIRKMEPLALVNCAPDVCCITSACCLKHVLKDAMQAFLAECDKYTLADLVQENPPLYRLLLV